MKSLSVLFRYRLLTNIMALGLALGALAAAPQPVLAEIICAEWCVAWDSVNGCTKMMSCCVESPDDWACVEWTPNY